MSGLLNPCVWNRAYDAFIHDELLIHEICGVSPSVIEFLTKVDWRIIEFKSLNKRTSEGCLV